MTSHSRRQRWLRLAGLAVVILLALLILPELLLRPAPPPSPAASHDAAQVAIFPFAVAGDERSQWLRDALFGLLQVQLEGAAGLRPTDHYAILAALDGAVATPAVAERIARRFGARLLLLGDITPLGGGRVLVTARLHDLEATQPAPIQESVEGADTDPNALVTPLVTGLLAAWVGGSAQRLQRIGALSSDSPNAIRAWIEGEQHFAASRYDRAVAAFERATDIDGSFAIAHYRLSMAAEWDLKFHLVGTSARQAMRTGSALPAHYRDLFEAWSHLVHGRADRAQSIYRSVAGQRQEEVEAWYGLGETIVHFNPLSGEPKEQGRTAFERVLELVPNFGDARYHLLEFAAAEGNRVAFDSLLAGVDTLSEQWRAWQAVRGFGFGTDAERALIERGLIDLTARGRERAVGFAAARVAANLHRFEDARRITAILAGSTDRNYRAIASLLSANLNVAAGRYRAALGDLADASPTEPAWSYEMGALFRLPDFLPASREDLLAARDSATLIDTSVRGSLTEFILGVHVSAHPLLRLYLMGMVSVRLGELEVAATHLAALRRTQTALESSLRDGLSESLDAHIRLARGERDVALRRLVAIRLDANIEQAGISPFYSRAYDRFVIAELQRESGNDVEAIRWYRSLIEGYDLLFVAPAHFRLSQIYAKLGQAETAAVHRQRFDMLWRDADADVRASLTGGFADQTR